MNLKYTTAHVIVITILFFTTSTNLQADCFTSYTINQEQPIVRARADYFQGREESTRQISMNSKEITISSFLETKRGMVPPDFMSKALMSWFKGVLRKVFILFHLDLTRNLKYDRLTTEIIRKNVKKNSNCIDVGCHKGEILDEMITYAPDGNHYAFEPIPYLYTKLASKYNKKANVFPYALSDKSGAGTFQLVKNAPAYSGLKKRRYDIANPEIEEIKIELKTMDEIIPLHEKIHFIKIDVEGGEFGVLKGAKNLLKRDKPLVIFEFGKGSSDYYGTNSRDLYNFITTEIGLSISTLPSFIKDKKPISEVEFENYFKTNREYYFVAYGSE